MADAASNDGEILEPQGNHYGWLSLTPLSEAAEWSSTPGVYFKKLQEKNGGAPIYKAHPGLACITITDHASGKWFFEQPDTVLDRQVSGQGNPCSYDIQCSECTHKAEAGMARFCNGDGVLGHREQHVICEFNMQET